MNKHLFILGDLNDDLLVPQSKLHRIMHVSKLSQVINKPTRITETSKTLLDVIITNNPDIISSSDVVKTHISDHDLIFAQINVIKPKREPEVKTFRSLSTYSKEVFCRYLLSSVALLNDILNTDDVNEQVEILTNIFNDCLDTCAPIVTKVIRRPPAPWITDDIKAAITNRDRLRFSRDNAFNENSDDLYR